MRRSAIFCLTLTLLLLALLPAGSALASSQPWCEVKWSRTVKVSGLKQGDAVRGRYLTLYFRWKHSPADPMNVRSTIKVKTPLNRLLFTASGTVKSDDLAWAKMRFYVKKSWKWGSYSVFIHGVDANGQAGDKTTWFHIKKY